MQVAIKQQAEQWFIVPLEGKHDGQSVAMAEAVAMTNVRKVGNTLVGSLSAIWGLHMLADNIDSKTRTGVMGRRCFDFEGCREVPLSLFQSAKRVIVSGSELLAA